MLSVGWKPLPQVGEGLGRGMTVNLPRGSTLWLLTLNQINQTRCKHPLPQPLSRNAGEGSVRDISARSSHSKNPSTSQQIFWLHIQIRQSVNPSIHKALSVNHKIAGFRKILLSSRRAQIVGKICRGSSITKHYSILQNSWIRLWR